MSRFFRSGDSTSSSEDEEEDEVDDSIKPTNTATSHREGTSLSSQVSALSVASQHQGGHLHQPSPQWTAHHKDVLLHSLLEDWCLNETVRSHEGATRDAPEIQAEARTKYLRLVSQLAPLDVVPAGLGADQHAATRQRYRDALGVFSRQNSETAVPAGARLLLTDRDAAGSTNDLVLSQMPNGMMQDQFTTQAPLTRLLGHTEANSSINTWVSEDAFTPHQGLMQHGIASGHGQTRYRSDFEELSILGRGGYGIVYHARNRLDNQAYAVKKVPLSAARLHRIRTRGQTEVDEILLELRTLARLHHPNIVRYFNAWVEWVDGSTPSAVNVFASSNDATDTQDSQAGAHDDRIPGHQRVFTEETDGNDIVFEHSTKDGLTQSEDDYESTLIEMSEPSQLRRIRTRSTIATASDETVETIDREHDVSVSIQSTPEGANFAQPTLAVHMQMSLHPMTLADLLGSKEGDRDGLRHCYHLEPAVGITTAVLNGLEYLHEEGVIHRDIKPANIFLSPSRSWGPKRDCVDLRKCGECDHESTAGGGELEICIGDFGLAAVASPETSEAEGYSASGPVGTAIYRPTSNDVSSSSPSLDIYALGIVLFELLWKFETRMERHCIIQALKEEGRYPDGFCERVGRGRGAGTMECVDCMLGNRGRGTSVAEVRGKLGGLVAVDG